MNRGINAYVFTKIKELLRFIPFFKAILCLFLLGGHTGFNVTFNGHFIRHWSKSTKLTNFNHSDYLEIAKCSALQRLPDDEITAIAERNLEIYDKL